MHSNPKGKIIYFGGPIGSTEKHAMKAYWLQEMHSNPEGNIAYYGGTIGSTEKPAMKA